MDVFYCLHGRMLSPSLTRTCAVNVDLQTVFASGIVCGVCGRVS